MQQHDTSMNSLRSLICLLTAKNSFRLSTFASNFGRMALQFAHNGQFWNISTKKCCWYRSHPPLRNEFHRNETCTYILLSNAVRHQPLQYQIKTETLDCKCQPNQIWTAWPCKSNAMVAVRIFWNKDFVCLIFLFNELVSKKNAKIKRAWCFHYVCAKGILHLNRQKPLQGSARQWRCWQPELTSW